jgi:nucleoid DNA-binding protein
MLKKPLSKKVVKTPQFTQSELKQAYNLVSKDLFTALKKAKDGSVIKLGNLGRFHKKKSRVTSALDGNTYLYYRISFKISSTLKRELDK